MDTAVIIKIMVFIILALFASWPYFEKFKEYSLLKRLWIGGSIFCLLVLGVLDIFNNDKNEKKDKLEIRKSTDTIARLSSRITKLSDKLDDMDDQQEDRFNKLADRITTSIQEGHGDISRSLRRKHKH